MPPGVFCGQLQQLQRPGALQERSVVPEAAVAAFGSVAGAFCGLKALFCYIFTGATILRALVQSLKNVRKCRRLTFN